jgi:ABC-type tungstate transport system substrate-binding protein
MNDLSSVRPVSVPPSGTKPSDGAVFAQIIALVLSVPAILFGLWMMWYVANPGPCGDFGRGDSTLFVLFCWVVDLPIGVLTLAIGLFAKKGAPRLRKRCIFAALVTLSLAIIAPLLGHHCT